MKGTFKFCAESGDTMSVLFGTEKQKQLHCYTRNSEVKARVKALATGEEVSFFFVGALEPELLEVNPINVADEAVRLHVDVTALRSFRGGEVSA